VQIAIAIPSLSAEEKDAARFTEADRFTEAALPPLRNDAGLKFFVIFLTQLANRSACVDIYINEQKKLVSRWYHNEHIDTSKPDFSH
jgi:hypothetical protein